MPAKVTGDSLLIHEFTYYYSLAPVRLPLNPGLHIVVAIAEYACDHVLKRILKLLIYRLQIFLVKYEYLESLQLCEDQGIPGKLKKRVCNHVLAILTIYMETRLNMTGYSHSYHSIKLIRCGAPQRDILSDKMVF